MIGGSTMVVMYIVLGIVIGISFITGVVLTIIEYKNKDGKKIPRVVPLYSVGADNKVVEKKNE